MCAAPAGYPCHGCAPHKLLSTHVPSHADELKRNFAEKLTTLRLRLSSQARCQTRVPPQLAWSGWSGCTRLSALHGTSSS